MIDGDLNKALASLDINRYRSLLNDGRHIWVEVHSLTLYSARG